MSRYYIRNFLHGFKKGHWHISKKGLEYCEKTGIFFYLWEKGEPK